MNIYVLQSGCIIKRILKKKGEITDRYMYIYISIFGISPATVFVCIYVRYIFVYILYPRRIVSFISQRYPNKVFFQLLFGL